MNTLVAILLVGMFPAMAILHHNTPNFRSENAVTIAERFLLQSPTFGFDGMGETVEVVNVEAFGTLNTWVVTIQFTSRNGGYGDRTGQMVITVLTEHQTRMVVRQGKVVEAVTDEVFDEITGEMINQGGEVEEAKEIALDFLMNAPTFSFDGIHGSMKIKDIAIAESYPVQYFITITFDCRHAGYGDRTGEVLAQVITSHEARVVVVEGTVRSAIIDEVWNEMEQRGVDSELQAPRTAVIAALEYLMETYDVGEDTGIPDHWTISNLTPEGVLGSMTEGYSGDGWDITVNWAVVRYPVYNVNVTYGENMWNLTVDQDMVVEEV